MERHDHEFEIDKKTKVEKQCLVTSITADQFNKQALPHLNCFRLHGNMESELL